MGYSPRYELHPGARDAIADAGRELYTNLFVGDDALEKTVGDEEGEFKYNLEYSFTGRLPAVLSIMARPAVKDSWKEGSTSSALSNLPHKKYAISPPSMYASGIPYEAGVDSDGTDRDPSYWRDEYTDFEYKLMVGNLMLKQQYPIPSDGFEGYKVSFQTGLDEIMETGGGYSVAFEVLLDAPEDVTGPSDEATGALRDAREIHEAGLIDGTFHMYWTMSHEGIRKEDFKDGYKMAYQRYKTMLRKFFGTRAINKSNCFDIFAETVKKLAGAWSYDDSPKQARIRMQKRVSFKNTNFSAIGEDPLNTELISPGTVTLDDEISPTSSQDVLPDDMPTSGGGGSY